MYNDEVSLMTMSSSCASALSSPSASCAMKWHPSYAVTRRQVVPGSYRSVLYFDVQQVDSFESDNSSYRLHGHGANSTSSPIGADIVRSESARGSETSNSSDDLSEEGLPKVSYSPKERRLSYRFTDPRQSLLCSQKQRLHSTNADLSHLVLHLCLQDTKAEDENYHHLTHARRNEDANDSCSWRENRGVNSSVESRGYRANIRTCLEGPRRKNKRQIDSFALRRRPNLRSELDRQQILLLRQRGSCQTGKDRLEYVDELLKLTTVAVVSDQAAGYNNTSRMIPVYFSESVSLGPVPNYEEHFVTTCVNYSTMKRYNETVEFRMNFSPVKFSSSVICSHDNTRKRFKTYVELVPRVKPRRFADSMVIRAKTTQTAYVSVLNYHIDECRRWFKSTLELRAKMYTTTKIQPISNKQPLNNNETDIVDRHKDDSTEEGTRPLVKSRVTRDVPGPSYHLSCYSTERFPPDSDKHSSAKIPNGHLGSSGEDSHFSSEEEDTYV